MEDVALLVDHYELTMLRAYHARSMVEDAVFSLYYRTLPPGRNYMLACGLDTVLDYLESFRFTEAALAHLATVDGFDAGFLDWLGSLRFNGDVWALPEGTPVFPAEPLIEVRASLPEAQVVETFLLNQVHLQTVLASKAVRVVEAASGRPVVDFGLRRMHGTDAGLKSARAFHIAGVAATSNVLAGREYGVPVTGTMAHSYVQAHDDEMEALRSFAGLFPGTILLVDTYDTLAGVRKVIRLAGEEGDRFQVRGIRLDSGDLGALSREARGLLDAAGLGRLEIFASGGLDEWEIRTLLEKGAPIDGFGVGTKMGVSSDAPDLDMAFKLTEYDGLGRLKLSGGKRILPGRKQVFRVPEGDRDVRDVLASSEESGPGRPLLVKVMEGGRRLPTSRQTLDQIRDYAREQVARLPSRICSLEPADPPFPVETSSELHQAEQRVMDRVTRHERADRVSTEDET